MNILSFSAMEIRRDLTVFELDDDEDDNNNNNNEVSIAF